jgi:hypothetical protein
MKHLKELGVKTESASIVLLFVDQDGNNLGWEVENHGKDKPLYEYYDEDKEIWDFADAEYFDARHGDYDHSYRYNCGVFTLQDIIELLPKELPNHTLNERYARLAIDFLPDKVSFCYLTGAYIMLDDYRAMGNTVLEAAYNMLCWIAEKKYFLKILIT